jgi:hypothetical protein
VSTGKKIGLAIFGIYLLTITLVVIIFGFKRVDNEEFKPQNEFKLHTWIDLPGPLDINKGVLYVIMAGILATLSSATTSPAAAWTTRWPASGSRSSARCSSSSGSPT